MNNDLAAAVPGNYAQSRQRFLEAAAAVKASIESFPLRDFQSLPAGLVAQDSGGPTPSGATSWCQTPEGEPLHIDVAHLGPKDAPHRLIATCGLHGVEAFYGAAVLNNWLTELREPNIARPTQVGVTLIHVLSPHGFAWTTRVNEDNIDPNRNFLLPEESFAGCPATYRQITSLLNPEAMPSRCEPFRLKMLGVLARHGMAALKQAIAGGQYEFPHGLFYGGQQPTATQRFLAQRIPAITAGAECVVHIDYHTGLGRRGQYAILCDEPLNPADRELLSQAFGREKLSEPDSEDLEYAVRGSIGRWCHHVAGGRYLTAGPEYGTYPPLTMLAGLREDNAARRYLPYGHPRREKARARLRELFCPASPQWRRWAVRSGTDHIHRMLAVLSKLR